MSRYYKLEGKKPIAVCFDEFATWYKKSKLRVADDTFDDQRISTVFLGFDHGIGGSPVLFETMVFGGKSDGFMQRYCLFELAKIGHKEIVEKIKLCIKL